MEEEGAAARDIMVNTGPIDLGGEREGGGKVGDSRMRYKAVAGVVWVELPVAAIPALAEYPPFAPP